MRQVDLGLILYPSIVYKGTLSERTTLDFDKNEHYPIGFFQYFLPVIIKEYFDYSEV